MVFYGKKRSQTEENYEQYRSIKEEILKQLGERITPVYEKSLATMFASTGEVISTATQSIINFPQYWRTTDFYQAYLEDRKAFRKQMQPEELWYQSLPNRLTGNKFFVIKNYTVEQRLFALNASVLLMSLAAVGLRKGFNAKMRSLMKTCVLGYSVGAIFLVPEIYNPLFAAKIEAIN